MRVDLMLVSKTETVWESFSEDEAPEPTKAKNAFSSLKSSASSSAGKAKKAGNISDFFGRK